MHAQNTEMPVRYTFVCSDCDIEHTQEGLVTHLLFDSERDCDNPMMFVVVTRTDDDDDSEGTVTNVLDLEDAFEGLEVYLPDGELVEFGDDRVHEAYGPSGMCNDCAAKMTAEGLTEWAESLRDQGVEALYVAHGANDLQGTLEATGFEYVEPGMTEGHSLHFVAGHNPGGSVFMRTPKPNRAQRRAAKA